MTNRIVLYINGTNEDNGIKGLTSLANVLHHMTIQDASQKSISVKGCSIDNQDPRDLGAIFTFNLERQLDEILRNEICPSMTYNEEPLTLDVYGFSRGGAAAFWLCQKIASLDQKQYNLMGLNVNLFAFEPVPGNFVRAAYLDRTSGTNNTLSAKIADLSNCRFIRKVYVVYTAEPLPDIACHAPILPIMPSQAEVDIDVFPGCHRGAELYSVGNFSKLMPHNDNSALSFQFAYRMLMGLGIRFNHNTFSNMNELLKVDTHSLSEIAVNTPRSTRAMHFYNEIMISSADARYLNKFHKRIAEDIPLNEPVDDSGCAFRIKDKTPTATYWNGSKSPSVSLPVFALYAAAGSSLISGDVLRAAGSMVTSEVVRRLGQ